MSLARLLGRLGGLLAAAVGAFVAYYGLLVGSVTVPRGLDALLAGEVNVFVVIGLTGVVVALVGLAVAAGRGRSWAITVGTLLVAVAALGLVLYAFSPLVVAVTGVVGFLLFFSGASLNGPRGDAA
ncbi:hypothetical protein C474_09969 [Halogeometricum pallidum JCM 14848]|uniref:Major facilitator superfamily (MFS) profile domain-containing protein n=1 Tax=Halogeometricum pallidum JCM 14848 TaxID=1227487 RepID=M0D8J6_HALPD|nr:hypothetical protein [Halogeometricum pallidum]ELZ31153.1 hypothetical protein C474_09969 [Halogeometricum pallidum JCM 14848]